MRHWLLLSALVLGVRKKEEDKGNDVVVLEDAPATKATKVMLTKLDKNLNFRPVL